MSDPTIIGTIPAGSTVIREATAEDRAADPRRMLLYSDKDGAEHWVCYQIAPARFTATIPVVFPSDD